MHKNVFIAGCWIAVSALGLMVGCEKKEPDVTDSSLQAPLGSDRPLSLESVARGANLYQEHCAQCHGPEAQGHPDWENPKVVAAPPLNGSGNEWKKNKIELVTVIKNGAKRNNDIVMPGWGGRLADQEIDDIVTWFQALWPIDVYDRWLKVNAGNGPGISEKKPAKKG